MPYSLETRLAKKFDEMSNRMLEEFDKETDQIWEKSINNTFKTLHEEAVNMYDTLIEEYYRYETKSYYRHHVGIGTGTGENLYYGKQIKLKLGTHPKLFIGFSGKEMDGYRHNSSDEVLSMVMRGIRGVPSKGWWETWKGSYEGKYFKIWNTNITTAFNIFSMNFNHLSTKVFKDEIRNEKKTGKYRFYK